MAKPQQLSVLLPSAVVAAIHFKLTAVVAPQANIVFQRWFDTGERASGADAVIESLNDFLAWPIPTVLLAGHPAYGFSVYWWVATCINSLLWGLAIYGCYRLPFLIGVMLDKWHLKT